MTPDSEEPRRLIGNRQQVEDQDGDRHREYAVAERLSPPGVHSRLVFRAGDGLSSARRFAVTAAT